MSETQTTESKLDSFDPAVRKNALNLLAGSINPEDDSQKINLHYHTFFSYNGQGYSPSHIAYLAKKRGVNVAGIVDFDVLDGIEEFLEAGRILNLPATAGIETRVFVREFADKEISSPGEPGIAYHMGTGIPGGNVGENAADFKQKLYDMAQQRNIELLDRVNDFLAPLKLDYNADVLPLTPAGNATERHLCLAYAKKAADMFEHDEKLKQFWMSKLGQDVEKLDFESDPLGVDLQGLIRSKTMKAGGPGYVLPDAGSFPEMAQMNEFVLEAGGIPTHAWLDGSSAGEKEIEKLLEIGMANGTAAVNIIPDRNYVPGQGLENSKCKALYEFVELAEKLNLPVAVGTEMNKPGQKFVDSFNTDELSRLLPVFMKGAYIIYAHTWLQRINKMGYLSKWSAENFSSVVEKNEFFHQLGAALEPADINILQEIADNCEPGKILETIKKT